MPIRTALLFDLDGTLIDSTYHHVLAWQRVFERKQILVPLWKIHGLIGISGGQLVEKLLVDSGKTPGARLIKDLEESHARVYQKVGALTRPFPRASELLRSLSEKKIPWAIATTGKLQSVKKNLRALGINPRTSTVVTRDDVAEGKPEPDVFLKAAETLEIPLERCIVIGDSVWDMLAAARGRALAVGLRCGGGCPRSLNEAGAIRVFNDPADLLRNLAEIVAA